MLADMVIVAGIDLAWSGRNPSGLCALEVDGDSVRLLELECRIADACAVADWLDGLGEYVLAAIDAPLIATPERRAEAEMARAWGSRGVFAYAARPAFLEARGIAEGPRLGAELAARDWSLDPREITGSSRVALEVFPHALTVALMGATRALRYKRGPIAARARVLDEFRLLVGGFASSAGLEGCPDLETPVAITSGLLLKAREDRLDAVACALGALHILREGVRDGEVFGDADHGYIVVPRRP